MLTIAVVLFLFKENNCDPVLPKDGSFEVNRLSARKPINTADLPDKYDWREHKLVSPVKDQAGCAACWAFSAVANIESHLKIYLGQEETLSEQFLIDCDDGNKGCTNGSIIQTFANIVTKLGGVLRDSDYFPYVSKKMDCRWEVPESGVMKNESTHDVAHPVPRVHPYPVPVVGFTRVFPDEEAMAESIYRYGPVSAAINSASMDKYRGDFIDDPSDQDCDPKQLNHAVLIVGYDFYVSRSGKRVPYWIIKNSWGPEWGDNGYYYLVRGRNACGIASDVSFAYVN